MEKLYKKALVSHDVFCLICINAISLPHGLSATGPFRLLYWCGIYRLPLDGPQSFVTFSSRSEPHFSCIDNAAPPHACFKTHKRALNELHAHANSNGRCLPAKLFISRACREKWFWFGVVACSGLGARGSCAHYNVHTWPSAPSPL